MKTLIYAMFCTVYVWFLLSFAWNREEMSVMEQVVGVIYGFVAVPACFAITRWIDGK